MNAMLNQPAPPPSDVVAQFRQENGLCVLCAAKCFNVTHIHNDNGTRIVAQLEPLTIDEEVQRGRCLRCQPLLLPLVPPPPPPPPPKLLLADDVNNRIIGR